MNPYIPADTNWEWTTSAKTGLHATRLSDAVELAHASECDWPTSLFLADGRFVGTAHVNDQPPHDQPIGVVKPRGGTNGLLLSGGRIVAEWGDTSRADTTFSAAKSYLSLLAGIAFDDGLIRSLDEPVGLSMPAEDDGFRSEHNAPITWRQLLQQTSEWSGTLWGKPDSVDHHRQAGPRDAADNRLKGTVRELQAPGTRFEYNDVRVNRLALSLTWLFRQPLGTVLRERIMEPIGASSAWEWHGYDNARIEIDGVSVASVSGGSHWGAGLYISTRDHARVGLLVARQGEWAGRQLISREYLAEMTRPCPANPQYGFMWWLNTDQKLFPSIPSNAVLAIGGGQHVIWVDAKRDLVTVLRWTDKARCDAVLGGFEESIKETSE